MKTLTESRARLYELKNIEQLHVDTMPDLYELALRVALRDIETAKRKFEMEGSK